MILSAIRKKYGTREAFGFLRKTTGSHYPNLRFWVQCKPTRQFFFFLFSLSSKSSQHSRYIILHLYVPHKLEERCGNTFWTDVFFGVTVVNRSKGSLKNVNNLMPHMKLIFFKWKKKTNQSNATRSHLKSIEKFIFIFTGSLANIYHGNWIPGKWLYFPYLGSWLSVLRHISFRLAFIGFSFQVSQNTPRF